MVRSARARGSKGANEKQPEEATPWKQMKQQMIEAKKKDGEQPIARVSLAENDTSEETTWAKFDDTTPKKSGKRSLSNKREQKSKGKKKKRLSNGAEDETSEKMELEQSEENVLNGNSRKKLTRYQKEKLGLAATPRKPHKGSKSQIMNLGTREVEMRRFCGFWVKKEDWERLTELQESLIKKNIPQEQIAVTLKLERRRAEKSLARERKKVCFNCRQPGHNLSECPALGEGPVGRKSNMPDSANTGVCFKCGSTEHTHFQCKVVKKEEFKFAKCFVCGEQGHISRQCPDNPQGMYPKGGACNICGDVTHLRRHCPKTQKEKSDSAVTLSTLTSNDAVEALDTESKPVEMSPKTPKKTKKIVKF